jgi:hypothetical protein
MRREDNGNDFLLSLQTFNFRIKIAYFDYL